MRTGIYVRISQDRGGEGLGVMRQEAACRELCAAKSWKVAEGNVYVDNDVSAKTYGKPRPEWERLIADVRAGDIDAIVVWDVDRLTRTPRELEDVITFAEQQGLELATCTGEIDLATPTGRLTARIRGSVARMESEQKSARQRAERQQSAERGMVNGGGTRPFGYAVDRRTVVRDEAEIVKECAERVLAGESLHSVARELRGRGVQTSAGNDWSPRSLRQMLMSARISGRRERHGEVVGVAVWPAIISVEDSDRLRLMLGDPARQTTRPGNPRSYLLSGLLRCGRCGAAMVGRRQRGVPRYCCPNVPGNCGGIYTNAARTDVFVRDVALTALAGPGLRAALRAQRNADPKLLAAVARDRVKLEELAAAWADDQMTTTAYKLAAGRVEARLTQGERKLARAGSPDPLAAFVGSYAQMVEKWAELNMARRRAILDAVLAEVVVRPARSHWDEGRFEFGWKA